MENKKQFYFNGVSSDIIVYINSTPIKLNISDFTKNFDCVLEREFNMNSSSIKKYKVNEDLYIDSLNEEGKLVTSKIEYIMHKEGLSDNALYDIEYNNDNSIISNIAIYDNKKSKIIISPIKDIEQKFIIQNIGKFSDIQINEYNNIKLNRKNGFVIGYWILRGGFNRIEKDSDDEFICFKGKDSDSDFMNNILNETFSNSTSFRKKSIKDFEFLVIINENLQEFIVSKFGKKNLPEWLLQVDNEFLIGVFYSFIYCRSYLSKDKLGNSYLVVLNRNKELLEQLNFLLKQKLGIYSKFISTNDSSLSFKINQKLFDLLKQGVDEKLINMDIESIKISETKEFFVKGYNYKIIPWYKVKFKSNVETENSYTLKLENNKVFMLSNGLFVLG